MTANVEARLCLRLFGCLNNDAEDTKTTIPGCVLGYVPKSPMIVNKDKYFSDHFTLIPVQCSAEVVKPNPSA